VSTQNKKIVRWLFTPPNEDTRKKLDELDFRFELDDFFFAGVKYFAILRCVALKYGKSQEGKDFLKGIIDESTDWVELNFGKKVAVDWLHKAGISIELYTAIDSAEKLSLRTSAYNIGYARARLEKSENIDKLAALFGNFYIESRRESWVFLGASPANLFDFELWIHDFIDNAFQSLQYNRPAIPPEVSKTIVGEGDIDRLSIDLLFLDFYLIQQIVLSLNEEKFYNQEMCESISSEIEVLIKRRLGVENENGTNDAYEYWITRLKMYQYIKSTFKGVEVDLFTALAAGIYPKKITRDSEIQISILAKLLRDRYLNLLNAATESLTDVA